MDVDRTYNIMNVTLHTHTNYKKTCLLLGVQQETSKMSDVISLC
jgi:hypothetical protein